MNFWINTRFNSVFFSNGSSLIHPCWINTFFFSIFHLIYFFTLSFLLFILFMWWPSKHKIVFLLIPEQINLWMNVKLLLFTLSQGIILHKQAHVCREDLMLSVRFCTFTLIFLHFVLSACHYLMLIIFYILLIVVVVFIIKRLFVKSPPVSDICFVKCDAN